MLQVASASITEIYLCEFHLVWQTVLARFQSVSSKAYMIIDGSPEVLVDAVRCARLLDAVLQVRTSLNKPCPVSVAWTAISRCAAERMASTCIGSRRKELRNETDG